MPRSWIFLSQKKTLFDVNNWNNWCRIFAILVPPRPKSTNILRKRLLGNLVLWSHIEGLPLGANISLLLKLTFLHNNKSSVLSCRSQWTIFYIYSWLNWNQFDSLSRAGSLIVWRCQEVLVKLTYPDIQTRISPKHPAWFLQSRSELTSFQLTEIFEREINYFIPCVLFLSIFYFSSRYEFCFLLWNRNPESLKLARNAISIDSNRYLNSSFLKTTALIRSIKVSIYTCRRLLDWTNA